jgi:hypothetical protein
MLLIINTKKPIDDDPEIPDASKAIQTMPIIGK